MLEALNPALLLGYRSALLNTRKPHALFWWVMLGATSFSVWLGCGQESLGFFHSFFFVED